MAGENKIAVYSRPSTGPDTLSYIREDHQGSVSSLLKSDGTPYVSESFTAFGNRRSACTWTGSVTNGNLAKINATTRRGYTWHTSLGAMGLNDMNGRIQDAVTGRFLSPDPYVFEPEYTQAYNRYSYVYNNPLSFTDPSGFEVEGGILFFLIGPGGIGIMTSGVGQYEGPITPRIPEQSDDVLRALANHAPAESPRTPSSPHPVPIDGGLAQYPGLPRGVMPGEELPLRDGIRDFLVTGVLGLLKKMNEPVGGIRCGETATCLTFPIFGGPGAAAKAGAQALPKLQRIHSAETLTTGRRDIATTQFAMSTDDIVRSLRPGADRPLTVKPDGRIFEGNTRIFVLEERGFDINSLPRLVVP